MVRLRHATADDPEDFQGQLGTLALLFNDAAHLGQFRFLRLKAPPRFQHPMGAAVPARRLQLTLFDGRAGTNFIRKVAQPQQRADFLGVEVGPFGLVLNLSFEVLKAPLESAEVAGHTVVLGLSSSTHVGSPFVSFVFSFYTMNLKQRNPDNSFSGTENVFCIEILL